MNDYDHSWLQKVMTQKKAEDAKYERDYFQKWLNESKWQHDLEKEKTVYERERIRKEKEYMQELRYKMEEQLRLVAEWDKAKLNMFEQGSWRLFKLPQDHNWVEVHQWCQQNFEPGVFVNGPSSMKNDWMIRGEQNHTTFALRWVD